MKQRTTPDAMKEVAQKSFMLGVNWLLKVLQDGDTENPGLWTSFTEDTSKLLRERAQKAIDSI